MQNNKAAFYRGTSLRKFMVRCAEKITNGMAGGDHYFEIVSIPLFCVYQRCLLLMVSADPFLTDLCW